MEVENSENELRARRVLVLGAANEVGAEIVRACALLGYQVVAADTLPCGKLRAAGVKTSDLASLDVAALAPVMRGCETVVCALFDNQKLPSWAPISRYSQAARALRAAMQQEGVKRIIATSSAAIEEGAALPWFHGHIVRRFDVNTFIDLARMETLLEDSAPNLEFTVVRLPLLVRQLGKHYTVASRTLAVGQFRIGLQDVGLFIAREIEHRKWVNDFPVPSYP